jgi:hypothetical protein
VPIGRGDQAIGGGRETTTSVSDTASGSDTSLTDTPRNTGNDKVDLPIETAPKDDFAPAGGTRATETAPTGKGGGGDPPEIGLQRRISDLRQRFGESAADPQGFERQLAEIERIAATDPARARRRLDRFDQRFDEFIETRGLAGERAETDTGDLITDAGDVGSADVEQARLTMKDGLEPDVKITDPATGLETVVDPLGTAMAAGNAHDDMRRFHGSDQRVTELFVEGPMGRRKVDAYEPGREIISAKTGETAQLGETDYWKALEHLQELSTKYPPGCTISDVPSSPPHLVGQPLTGRLILEVPVQRSPIPQRILDEAAARGITIRDTAGREY